MKKALIVDDSLTVRMDLDEAFRAAGWATTLCPSAAAAREAIHNEAFDCVILDLLLPGGDGLVLLQEIKDPGAAGPPVILLSAEGGVADGVRGLPAAPDAYVAKPYDRAQVVAQAQRLGDRRHASAPASPAILAVDDSATYLHALAEQLRQDNLEVVPATSGRQALDVLAERAVDCVLLDMLMPGLSGQEVCRRIKDSPRWRTIPVIMLTGREDREAILESFNAGADDYVTKSGDFAVLRARLRAQLRRRQIETETERIREELHQKEIEVAQAKAAEDASRERERFRRAVLDTLPAKIAVLDTAGAVIAVNEQWQELALGTNYLDFCRQAAAGGDSGAGEAMASIESVLRGQAGEIHFEYPCHSPTEQQWFLTQVTRPPAHVGGAIISHMDITERKLAEEALKTAMEELARSNKDLEQFAYVASHDLQEPLRMVGGFLRLLEERCGAALDDKAKEYLRYSVDGAARMAALINDLLEYSRVGRRGTELQPVEVGQALAAALANLGSSIREAGAAVTHEELPTVRGDRVLLMQLFQNLIGNAIKFRLPRRPCQVHVAARRDGSHWVLSVRDNGIGIPAEHSDRVFVIFQRLHGREKYPGTGIGLAICKRIIERHGGRIWVESTEGSGATFFFTLPA